MRRFNDIHTHTPGKPDSILSIPACDADQIVSDNRSKIAPQYFSLQLHPWHITDEHDIVQFVNKARALRDDPQFVAIGECGLDSLSSTPPDLQLKAFRAALQVADELHKPVIIHCVKCWNQVITEVKGHEGPFIIHGFRKGPVLARQLLDAGFSLSLGLHYHPEVIKIIPEDRLYRETDEE